MKVSQRLVMVEAATTTRLVGRQELGGSGVTRARVSHHPAEVGNVVGHSMRARASEET